VIQVAQKRPALFFRSSGMDAAVAPSAHPKGTSFGRRDAQSGRRRKKSAGRWLRAEPVLASFPDEDGFSSFLARNWRICLYFT
ncbi:MAG: hypothetical protein AB2707_15005, partial [Candidatus Thiodiazotropha sp.]